jgi:hypothetical protein
MQRKILVQHIFFKYFLHASGTVHREGQNTNVVFLFIKAYSYNIALMQNSEMLGVLVSKAPSSLYHLPYESFFSPSPFWSNFASYVEGFIPPLSLLLKVSSFLSIIQDAMLPQSHTC